MIPRHILPVLQMFLFLVHCDLQSPAQDVSACRNLNADEFYIRMHSSQNPLLIDTRTAREFRKERIPGAILAGSVSDLEKMADSLDLDQPIFLYCEKDNRSPVACSLLCEKGFRNVYNLREGLIAWRKTSYPMERRKSRIKN